MSNVNLTRNGLAMQKAWKEVLDPDNPTDWALYCYEEEGGSNNNVLTLYSSGSEGLEELREDLNPNKIMYAFLSIEEPKTKLNRYILINWQGESALATRKGTCATHVRDIAAYFSGSHLTINARDEDDLEIDEVMERIKKAPRNFDFRTVKPSEELHDPDPVGTSHTRIVPSRELPSADQRESFWKNAELEEQKRKEENLQNKKSLDEALEAIRLVHEAKESEKRDLEVEKRAQAIQEKKEAESALLKNSQNQEEDTLDSEEFMLEESERKNRGLLMGKERVKEAASLISGKSSEARAVFLASSSDGQLHKKKETLPDVTDTQTPPDVIANVTEEEASLGLCAVSLYDYSAMDDTEISFNEDQLITNIQQVHKDWWLGIGPDDFRGLFPANFVKIIEETRNN